MKLKRYVLGCYAIWVIFLIAAYYGLPALRIETWGLISLSGVIAIVAGTVLNRPARKGPWLVLAAAQASFAAGQLSFLIAAKRGVVLPFPSFADALYLLYYPAAYVGLVLLLRERVERLSTSSWLDGAIAATTSAAVIAALAFEPIIHSATQGSVAAVATNLAYPVGDLILLAIVFGVFGLAGWRPGRAWLLLGVGLATAAIADTVLMRAVPMAL